MSLHNFNPAYFTIDQTSPVVVATVTRASLCEEDNIEQFGVELNQVVDHLGCKWLALDMSQVKWMTSAAIGKLIALHRSLHRRDGQLTMCGMTVVVYNVFQSANLIDYFHLTSSVAEAIDQLVRAKSVSDTSL